ncbi:MAG TPA: DUF1566 domain-containing protein [Tichowtungia sp.]|nr:DUF1566 domain-containing protein [Tichowtungia sp.]
MRVVVFVCNCLLLCSVVSAELTVTNVVVRQVEGTKTVEIIYDLACDETDSVSVSLMASNGPSELVMNALSGDVGVDVTPGVEKKMQWDAGSDWNGDAGLLDFLVVAASDDGATAVCSLPKTGQTESYRTGDDGAFQKGVAWPTPRFVDQGDQTVLDQLTGLIWVKDPGTLSGNSANMKWAAAVDLCNDLDYAGRVDWRLANLRELESLVNYSASTNPAAWLNSDATPFDGVSSGRYWTSTSHHYSDNNAWYYTFSTGLNSTYGKTWVYGRAWPVRSGAGSSYPAALQKTGETQSDRTGDDGDLEKGIASPSPRFTDHGDGTVIDHLTGLQWIKQPQALTWNSSSMNWNYASSSCDYYDYAGYSDWRLPNIKEMLSLIDYGRDAYALPGGHPFSGMPLADYWTSTTCGWDTSLAWRIDLQYGVIKTGGKTSYTYVWPVRDADPVLLESQGKGSSGIDARDYSLTVDSDYGTAVPPDGLYSNYCWGTVITCSVNATVLESGTNYVCTHWSGTGSVPAMGLTNHTGAIQLTNLVSSIIWRWIADDDSDGLDDQWERSAFGDLSGVYDGNPDQDEFLNWQEYIAGTDPDRESSIFAVTNALQNVNNTNGFVVSWHSIPERVYTVLWSSNLMSGFEVLQTDIEYPVNCYTDTVYSAESDGFFMIEVKMK